MKKAFFKVAALIVLIYLGAEVVTNSQTTGKQTTNDVKIRQRMSTGNGSGAESLLYIKGQRMRTEMPGNVGFTTILQCDLKRTLTINENTKTYLISPTDGTGSTGMAEGDGGGAPAIPNAQPQASPRGGIVNITNTLTDTGERKQMFGFNARHIKTSMVKTASPDACDKDLKVETDGWYIDFQYAFECPSQMQKHQQVPVRPQQPGCKDEIRTKTIGTAKLGFPLLVTTTIYQPDGRTTTMTQEVLELSREQLSASLFDVPEGYTLAKSMNELYGINTASAAYNPQPTSDPAATGVPKVTAASTAKKTGVIRIGLMTPKVQTSSGDAARTTETLRNSFVGQLNGQGVEVVALSSPQLGQALDEARKSQCDYLLSVSMTIKKGGGSMFGRAIGNIAASAAGVPTGGAINAIKAKDELSLEYNLESLQTSTTVLSKTTKAKARSDGEDLITSEVQKASQAILAVVKK